MWGLQGPAESHAGAAEGASQSEKGRRQGQTYVPRHLGAVPSAGSAPGRGAGTAARTALRPTPPQPDPASRLASASLSAVHAGTCSPQPPHGVQENGVSPFTRSTLGDVVLPGLAAPFPPRRGDASAAGGRFRRRERVCEVGGAARRRRRRPLPWCARCRHVLLQARRCAGLRPGRARVLGRESGR